jgi:hypothetical protein
MLSVPWRNRSCGSRLPLVRVKAVTVRVVFGGGMPPSDRPPILDRASGAQRSANVASDRLVQLLIPTARTGRADLVIDGLGVALERMLDAT